MRVPKTQLFYFQAIPHSLHKTPGVGYPFGSHALLFVGRSLRTGLAVSYLLHSTFNRGSRLGRDCLLCVALPQVTEHGPRVTAPAFSLLTSLLPSLSTRIARLFLHCPAIPPHLLGQTLLTTLD